MSKINEVVAYFLPFEIPCAVGLFKGISSEPQDKYFSELSLLQVSR